MQPETTTTTRLETTDEVRGHQFVRLLSLAELRMIKAASDDKSRGAMCGLLVERGGLVVATNGHILATLRDPAMDPVEFPLHPTYGTSEPIPAGGIVIPSAVVEWAIKAVPKKSSLNVLQRAALMIRGNVAALVITDLSGWQERTWNHTETGRFPEWRNVWRNVVDSEATPFDHIGFDARYLERIAELAGVVYTGSTKFSVRIVALSFKGNDRAAEFQATYAGVTLRGLLMPLRLDTEGADAPKNGVPE